MNKYKNAAKIAAKKDKYKLTVSEPKKQLEALLPYGLVATKKWLATNGMGRHSLDNALKSRKLVALAAGVYVRPGVNVSWKGVVSSLQRISKAPIHVGGVTALELLGYGHYLSASPKKNIHIYSEDKLPSWVSRLNLDSSFHWHGTKTLWPRDMLEDRAIVKGHLWWEDMPEMLVSVAEKACLEMLADVPKTTSFEHADELMQGLTSLSPRKLEKLLTACRNVKAKRLFFWFAERQGYSWAMKMNHQDFDLGEGKRVVMKDGRLDKEYRITVPEHMHGPK